MIENQSIILFDYIEANSGSPPIVDVTFTHLYPRREVIGLAAVCLKIMSLFVVMVELLSHINCMQG